jgi:uncharacterized protein DUF6221
VTSPLRDFIQARRDTGWHSRWDAFGRWVLADHIPNAYDVERGQTASCLGCNAGYDEEPATEDIEQCPTLRALAAVWSEHPDYRPEWQVT